VPKMFLHAPKGTFTTEARARVAAELTELGMACERLIDTPQIRAGLGVGPLGRTAIRPLI
jgi:hypothetical protein